MLHQTKIAISVIGKQCICIYKCEKLGISTVLEMPVFLLVEALPQSPENTDLCSGNAAK